MFKNTFQSGLLSIFYACGSDPLAIWDMEVNNGHIKRLTDKEVNSIVLEIVSTNVATTYITCPPCNKVLGIKLPFLVMIVKNLKRYFSFEITILDDKNLRRRFRISNFQSTTKIMPFCTNMPIGLAGGWNQIQFNLSDFTRKAYGTQYMETQRVQVHANTRLRRIYFSDRLYPEEELPQDYKLFLPLERKKKPKVEKKKEERPSKVPATPPTPADASSKIDAQVVKAPATRASMAQAPMVQAPAEPEPVVQKPDIEAEEGSHTTTGNAESAESVAKSQDGVSEGTASRKVEETSMAEKELEKPVTEGDAETLSSKKPDEEETAEIGTPLAAAEVST